MKSHWKDPSREITWFKCSSSKDLSGCSLETGLRGSSIKPGSIIGRQFLVKREERTEPGNGGGSEGKEDYSFEMCSQWHNLVVKQGMR